MNVRAAVVGVLGEVVSHGRSLSACLPEALGQVPEKERALFQELCFGTLRYWPQLDERLKPFLSRPLKRKDSDIRFLLLLGLYQLTYMRIAIHAVVNETVAAAEILKKGWAKGLVNAVLRNYLRALERGAIVDASDAARYAHPQWLVDRLRRAWPQDWGTILEANNQRPPMALRVNAAKVSRDEYLARLASAGIEARPSPIVEDALLLVEPRDVASLPGFAQGLVSVQDVAAQLAAYLLAPAQGQRVLDACAAPGGKTCHILERQPGLDMLIAVDRDEQRLQRVAENLARLDVRAKLAYGDAAQPDLWWDGKPFDGILLDAPCSATGVIRRHPDIKLLRREEDIAELAREQARLLAALWPLLRVGGRLVYATCSVLPEENSDQVAAFLASHRDAKEVTIAASWGRACGTGRQILPGEDGMDGFFYACLERTENTDADLL